MPNDPLDILRKAPREVVLEELNRVDCENSLAFFIHHFWKYIDPSEFVGGIHIDAICQHLEAVTRGEIRKLVVNIPPRHSKSSVVSVAWPVWTWVQQQIRPLGGPQVQFLYSSYAQRLSERDSVKSRRLIESAPFQKYWGKRFNLVGDQNTKQKFENDKGGYRLSTSTGGTLTGDGAMVLVCDDPNNAVDVESEAERLAVLEWWQASWQTRLNDPKTGAMVVIQQRLHTEDVTGFILDNDKLHEWEYLCLPLEYDPDRKCQTSIGWEDPRTFDGEILCPERFGEKEVESLKQNLGPFRASGQLAQMPMPKGGGIFKRDWWQLWPPESYDDSMKLQFPPMEYIVVSVDTAYTEKQENDYSACTMWGVWRDKGKLPRVMLMKAWKERLEFHALVEKVIETCRNKSGSPCDALLIEAKASGISVAQEIKRLCSEEEFAIHKINPGAQDKVARAYAVQHLFSSGCVYAPDRKYADTVISEMEVFPKGKNDDLTDSCTMALGYLRKIGLAVLAEEGARANADEAMYRPQTESIADNYGV